MGVIVDLAGLVAGVDGGDGRVAEARECPREGLIDGSVDRRLGLFAVTLGKETHLFGNGHRDRLVAGGAAEAVIGQTRVLEALGQLLLIQLASELAKANQGYAPALEAGLPARVHARDVVQLGVRVARVAPGIVAVGDVVDGLAW